MPEISSWDGVRVCMYYCDDREAPHFHARYSGVWIQVDIETGAVTRGPRDKKWPRSELRRLERWRLDHLEELRANWTIAREQEAPLQRIPPAGR